MKVKRINKIKQAMPNQLPFLFPIQDEDEHSTESSLKQPDQQNSSFYRELSRASPPYRCIMDRNPLKMQRHVSPNPLACESALPFRRRARSNSPVRNCFTIAEEKPDIFPCNKPVLAVRDRKMQGDSFSGLIFQKGEVDEDEDLKLSLIHI